MNKKVSITLRILAILLAAGGITLFFLIRGEMEYAKVKSKDLTELASTSEDPFNYKAKSNPKKLRDSMDTIASVKNEVIGRRKQKKEDDATMAHQKRTIEMRDLEIVGLKEEIEQKNKEISDLIRTKGALEGEVATLKGKVGELESEVNMQKQNIASLTQRMATMKTAEEYEQKLNEIADLEKEKERGQGRYVKLRNYLRGKGEVVPAEFPIDLYSTAATEAPVVVFTSPYFTTQVASFDKAQGIVVLAAGVDESKIVMGGGYEVEVNGKIVAKLRITKIDASYSVADVLPNSDISALQTGEPIKLIPFVIKTTKAAQ